MSRLLMRAALPAIVSIVMLGVGRESASQARAAGREDSRRSTAGSLRFKQEARRGFGAEFQIHRLDKCLPAPCPCTRIEKRTVLVPVWVTECRSIPATEIRHEEREREFVVYKDVPEVVQKTRSVTVMEKVVRPREESYTVQKPVTEKVPQTETVCVPYTETRTATRTVLKPVTKEVERKYTVNVPFCEKRTGIRTVSKCVPVVRIRDICVDEGCWQERASKPVCKKCGPCGPAVAVAACKCRVWVPKLIHKQECCTVKTIQTAQVPYEYEVKCERPEVRTKIEKVCTMVPTEESYSYEVHLTRTETHTRFVEVCKMVPEVRTRIVNETVCVPRQKTETYTETVVRRVAEKRICKETVCVPCCTTREITVRVCKMVPKTVDVAVAAKPVCVPRYARK